MAITRYTSILALLLLGACASERVDFSKLPQDMFGPGQDIDNSARIEASRAFDSDVPPLMSVAQRARAMAEVEFLGGELNSGGEWSNLAGITQAEMLQARQEVRDALGIAPTARSQQIVDALLAVSRTENAAAQAAAVTSPIFTLSPQATLDHIQNARLPRTRHALGDAGRFDQRQYDMM